MAVSGMLDLDADFGWVDARDTGTVEGTNKGAYGGQVAVASTEVENANYNAIANLDTRLSALDATTYTVAYLRTLTKNDKQYALRLLRDAAGVK